MKKKIINVLVIVLVSVFSLAIGASAATTIASTSVSYGNTTVKAALDELISVASQCPDNALCSKVSIGDYVSMTPTETSYTIPASLTGYTSDQTINPSELNLWRVIDIKSDGTIEMVSEYVSNTQVYFMGLQSYLNFVGTLNMIANQYGNSKYTIRTRHMGYNGQTATITDISKFTNPAPWTASTSDNSNESLGGGDVMHTYDTDKTTGLVYKALGTLKANKVGTATATGYWLGARFYYYGSATKYYWFGCFVYSSGGVANQYYTYRQYGYNNGWGNNSISNSIRPIVTLRSDITSYSGAGTSASPWVLS